MIYPETGEVGVGVVIGFVMRLHQCGDDRTLLLREAGLVRFLVRLLILPLLDQILLPLHLLIGQDNCHDERRENSENSRAKALN